MTVRRDIHSLEELGRALSVAGGCTSFLNGCCEAFPSMTAAFTTMRKAAIGQRGDDTDPVVSLSRCGYNHA